LGNVTTLNSSTLQQESINITVNGTTNMSRLLNQTLFVNVTNGTRPLVEFYWNFSLGSLLFNFTVDVQNATSPFGSILVKGLHLQQNQSKNITINNVNDTIDTICIKDAEVSSLANISKSCNDANETLITCPGVVGSYNCSLIQNNQFYRITGANFTAAKEQCADSDADGYYVSGCGSGNDCNDNNANVHPGAAEVCGDGIDNDCSNGDAVCSSTGSSGGGGGGGVAMAVVNKASKYFSLIPAGETAEMIADKKTIAVTKVSFTTTSQLSGVTLDIKAVEEKDVPIPINNVFQYFEISLDKGSKNVSSAQIDFKVNKSWIASNDYTADSVLLNRLVDKQWLELPTELLQESIKYYHYSSQSSGLSYFAITAEKKSPAIISAVSNETVTTANETMPKPPSESVPLPLEKIPEKRSYNKLIALIIVFAILLAAALQVILLVKRKKIRHRYY
jgi:PGF-pre-PGF domain-containing protein